MKKLLVLMFLFISMSIYSESFIGKWNVTLYHIDKGKMNGGSISLEENNYCEVTNNLSGEKETRETTYHFDKDYFFIGSSGYYFTWVDDNHFELIPAFETVYYRLVFRRTNN